MSDKAAIIVNFPVTAHVYKYLQSKCGEKLAVTKNCLFGSTILDILTKKESDLQSVTDEYTFPVEISLRYMEKVGFYVDAQILRKFNDRVDKTFREEMRAYVHINFDFNNIPREKSLKQFLSHYNICEDDIKFETLVKDYKRNPRKIEAA